MLGMTMKRWTHLAPARGAAHTPKPFGIMKNSSGKGGGEGCQCPRILFGYQLSILIGIP